MNIWDWVLLAALILAVMLAVRSIWKNRKRSCGGSCADCGRACGTAARKR